jgi:hypothetical protein
VRHVGGRAHLLSPRPQDAVIDFFDVNEAWLTRVLDQGVAAGKLLLSGSPRHRSPTASFVSLTLSEQVAEHLDEQDAPLVAGALNVIGEVGKPNLVFEVSECHLSPSAVMSE